MRRIARFAQRAATLGSISTAGKGSGCNCKPAYYVRWRDSAGFKKASARVRNRREAERMLTAKQHDLDQGRSEVQRERNMTFPQWADKFESEILPARKRKQGMLGKYAHTLKVARETIGHVQVRTSATTSSACSTPGSLTSQMRTGSSS